MKYAPPEIILKNKDEKGEIGLYSDVWSLGIIIFKIYYGKAFWGKMTNNMVIEKILAKDIPQAENSKEVPEEITMIVNKALVYEGKKRITLEEIFELFEKAKER